MNHYPEHAKLNTTELAAIQAFFDFLRNEGYVVEHPDKSESKQTLIYRFFEVDEKILEKERLHMLENF